MVHLLLILVHVGAAVLASVAGSLALTRPRWAGAFTVLVVVSLLGLAAAVATAWPELDTGTRTIDAALLVLFVVVAVRVERARRVPAPERYASVRFLAGTGFGLIALADGFVVVLALDLGAPGGVLVACGLGIAGVGHLLLARLLRRRTGGPAGPRPAVDGHPAAADREANRADPVGGSGAVVGTAHGAPRPQSSR